MVHDGLQDRVADIRRYAQKRPRRNPAARVAEVVRGSVDDVRRSGEEARAGTRSVVQGWQVSLLRNRVERERLLRSV